MTKSVSMTISKYYSESKARHLDTMQYTCSLLARMGLNMCKFVFKL